MIEYQYNKNRFQLNEERVSSWLEKVILEENSTLGEIGYVFCDDEELLEINQKFLSHDTYTDVITFSNSDIRGIISGEIYISFERVQENSLFSGFDFERELHRVMVHGVLHLLGYPDKRPEEERRMRQKEDYYLSLF